MKTALETLHLNPLPRIGERRIAWGDVELSQNAAITGPAAIRLSLSQRERMKVRDCFL
jgi:hypothetical protein